MTQLVVHTGTPMTNASLVREQLVAWRAPLEHAGLVMVRRDDAKAWDRAVRQLLGGESPPLFRRLDRRNGRAPARAVLLSSPSAGRAIFKARNVVALRAFCRDHDVTCKVVVIVREQLDLLNALYCHQVMGMVTLQSFESFVTEAVESGDYDYAATFASLLGDSDVELVAVPYSRLRDDIAARVLLVEGGLMDRSVASGLSGAAESGADHGNKPLEGPVLIAAMRLLQKRLTRLGMMRRRPRAALAAAAHQLHERAVLGAWDTQTFWGWGWAPELAARAEQRFAAGNAEFAAAAWSSAWPDAPPARPTSRLDLATQSPALVSDVMTTIQRLVDELVSGLGENGDSA